MSRLDDIDKRCAAARVIWATHDLTTTVRADLPWRVEMLREARELIEVGVFPYTPEENGNSLARSWLDKLAGGDNAAD